MNKEQTPRNVLGKLTFTLVCIYTLLYIGIKGYTLWALGQRFNGWDNLIELSVNAGPLGVMRMIIDNIIIPIICTIVCLIYVIVMGRNKRISKETIAFTVFAMNMELILLIFGGLTGYMNSVPVFSLITRGAFIVAFILFMANTYMPVGKKLLFIAGASAFFCLAVNTTIYFMNNIAAILQAAENLQGIDLVLVYGEYFALPILGIITVGFVLGHIIFPEKFFKDDDSDQSMGKLNFKEIIGITLICAAILYCGVCSAYRDIKYGDYFKAINSENPLKENGYTYFVKDPNFLSFTGNLVISEDIPVNMEEKEWTSFSLMIWPKVLGGHEVSAGIHLGKMNPETLQIHTEIHYILLDEEWKPDETDEDSWKIYMDHKDEFDANWDRLIKLKKAAENKWDL